MEEYLILVDNEDRQYGSLEKLLVHQLGLLHRAFSVFIFNAKGELLTQQRSATKYHSAGLWSNTCCSHPLYGEEINRAVERRLNEEMGMKCHTFFAFSFIYKAQFENGLSEHEFDHVYFGMSDVLPVPAKDEVQNWKYIAIDELEQDIKNNPGHFTEWLKICLPEVKKRLFK
ncbi:MAG: isopentenyl-diphosphate Delta-isomerase [Bacteroidia bacterium]|nr:isopentenyl-diphosphate Delta-isomerase [Nitrosopumilus sp.]